MGRPTFPMRVDAGSAHLMIYRHYAKNKSRRRSYPQFKISYYECGRRKFETRSTLQGAQKRAARILVALQNGELRLQKLTHSDGETFLACQQHLNGTGVEPDRATKYFAKAFSIIRAAAMKASVTTDPAELVIEAAERYAQQVHQVITTKTVDEVVVELVEFKEKAKCSKRYVEDLDNRCTKFSTHFARKRMSEITATDARQFLALKIFGAKRNETLGPRSHNNFVGALRTLFKFAKDRDYLRQDNREMERVELLNDRGGDIEIYTPQEMADLLSHATDEEVSFIATCGFAGLRTEEFFRLDWQEVKWRSDVIEVTAGKAKTAQRRLVPITANLRAWLEPYAKTQGNRGQVWKQSLPYLHERMVDLFALARVTRKANALRHSFISYRVAETQDVARVAMESGNSPKMIFSNYRELVLPDEAKQWFSIVPAAGEAASVGKSKRRETKAKDKIISLKADTHTQEIQKTALNE